MTKRAVVALLLGGGLGLGAAVGVAAPEQVARGHRQAAVRAADQLLDDVVLPDGATELAAEPKGDGDRLAGPIERLFFAAQVDRHAFWTTDASRGAVLAALKAHLPPGARPLGSGFDAAMSFASYDFPAIDPATLGARRLVVEAVRVRGTTAVRADAEVSYLAPRPADQQVSPRARVLDITMTNSSSKPLLSLTVTRPTQVRRIAALVDRLPFTGNRSGVSLSCPGFASAPIDTFSFRVAPEGRILATVTEPADTPAAADPCELTALTIGGHHEPALMEGGSLLRAAGSLLGVKLTTPDRRRGST